MKYKAYDNGNITFQFTPEERRILIKIKGLCRRIKKEANNTEDYLNVTKDCDFIIKILNKFWDYDDKILYKIGYDPTKNHSEIP